MSIKASYFKENNNHLVQISYKNQDRIFKVFSQRAGKCLALMAEKYPEGITTKDMREHHGIDDNKLFGELLDQSGFREYMEHIGTKDRLKVWKLDIDALFENID